MVWEEGFEPPTTCAQGRCATRLRYTQYGAPCGNRTRIAGLEGRSSAIELTVPGSGGANRTHDLDVMSVASYLLLYPAVLKLRPNAGLEPAQYKGFPQVSHRSLSRAPACVCHSANPAIETGCQGWSGATGALCARDLQSPPTLYWNTWQ